MYTIRWTQKSRNADETAGWNMASFESLAAAKEFVRQRVAHDDLGTLQIYRALRVGDFAFLAAKDSHDLDASVPPYVKEAVMEREAEKIAGQEKKDAEARAAYHAAVMSNQAEASFKTDLMEER